MTAPQDTACAVYRFYSGDHLLYVGASCDPARRIGQHRSRSEWARDAANTSVCWFPSRDEALTEEAKAIATEGPLFNISQVIKPDATHAAVAARVKVLRLKSGLSQADFAKSLGVKVTQYGNWETGFRQPSVAAAITICEAHGVTLDWLFRGITTHRAAS